MRSLQTFYMATAVAAVAIHTARAFLHPTELYPSQVRATGRNVVCRGHRLCTGGLRIGPAIRSLAMHNAFTEETIAGENPHYPTKRRLKCRFFGAYYRLFPIVFGLVARIGFAVGDILTLVIKICTFGRSLDKNGRVGVVIGHLWWTFGLIISFSYPKITGRGKLDTPHGEKNKPAMYVANHSHWLDIPFLAMAVGWNNYKFVSKQELAEVPIIRSCLRLGNHIILDRTSHRSQLGTYREGVAWLKNGVNLLMYPEGTRSKDGRLKPFRRGAFRMAQAAGVPVVPVTIRYAHFVQAKEWVFPFRLGGSVPVDVVVGKPISTEGKSVDDLIAEVRAVIVAALPECQKPLD